VIRENRLKAWEVLHAVDDEADELVGDRPTCGVQVLVHTATGPTASSGAWAQVNPDETVGLHPPLEHDEPALAQSRIVRERVSEGCAARGCTVQGTNVAAL